jgi:hypothetical protein
VEQEASCDDGFGSNLRSGEAEEGLGEDWEVVGGRGGYGGGFWVGLIPQC